MPNEQSKTAKDPVLTYAGLPLQVRDEMIQQLTQFPYGQVNGIINALLNAPHIRIGGKAITAAPKTLRKKQRKRKP